MKENEIPLTQQLAETEHRANHERDIFVRLLNRISYFCRGYQLELDHKLGQLRAYFTGENQSSGDSTTPIEQLESLLIQQSQDWDKRLRNGQLALSKKSVALLQRHQALPTPLKKDLKGYLQSMGTPISNVFLLLDRSLELAEFYERALNNGRPENIAIQQSLTKTLDHRALRLHLTAMLNELSFGKQERKQFQECLALLQDEGSEQFVIHLGQWLEIAITAVSRRYQKSEQFLTALADTLSNVQSSLYDCLRHHHEHNERIKQKEYQLKAHLSAMSDAVREAENMDDLQEVVLARLDNIMELITVQPEEKAPAQSKPTEQLMTLRSRLQRMENEIAHYQQELTQQRRQAMLDTLTELPNRTAYEHRLAEEYQNWEKHKTPLTLAIIDLDLFKHINDTYGHSAGDRTLKVIGQMLNKWIKNNHFVARYGGEEFIVLLPGMNQEKALEFLEALRQQIAELRFSFRGQAIRITASLGAASFHDEDIPDTVFERADKALYTAKQQGRNQLLADQEEQNELRSIE